MLTGICTLELHLFNSHSLKDKRRIIKSIVTRLRSRFNISIAEVGSQEHWNFSVLGLAIVSTDRVQLDRILSEVIKTIDQYCEVELSRIDQEII